jgi:hypothetical protein
MHSTSCKPLLTAVLASAVLLIPDLLFGQQQRRGFWRIEAGRADIHRASSTGMVAALRLGRRADSLGVLRIDLGASYSGADEGYLTVEFGAEVRPLARARVTPVLGVGVGLLSEPEFTGEIVRGTLALEVEVASGVAVRLGGQLGRHGGQRGPNVLFGGLELRGRRR